MGAFNLGAFTEGFKGGYGAVRENQRSKLIDKVLGQRIAEEDSAKKGREAMYDYHGEDFASDEDYMPQSLGSKILGFMGGKGWGKEKQTAISPGEMGSSAMGMHEAEDYSNRAFQGESAANFSEGMGEFGGGMPQQDMMQSQAGMPVMTARHGGAIERYADGGSVRHMVKKYAGGGRATALYSGVKGFANGGRSLAPNQMIVRGNYDQGGMAIKPVGYADGGPLQYSGVAGEGGPRAMVPKPVGVFAHGGAIERYAEGGVASIEEQLARKATAETQLSRDMTPEQRTKMAENRKATEAKQAKADAKTAKTAKPSAKPSGGAAAGTRTSAITGRELAQRAASPRWTERLANATKATGLKGAAASTGVGLIAGAGAMFGAEQIGKAAGALMTGQDITDEEIGMTATSKYRDQLGMTDPSENNLIRAGGDVLARTVGVAGELGDAITFGYASKAGEWLSNKIAGVDPEQAAAVQAIDKDEPVNVGAQPDANNPPNQVADAAPKTVIEVIAAEEDPIIDMSKMREIRPEEMPSKGQKDWEEERNFYAAFAISQGEDPLAAMKAVDEKQMRGFTMYANQAANLLMAGDATAAANALYAAYQYFPNGKDVRFGIMKGEGGKPVIIGMGTDEATGEEAGEPMVMTSESIFVQVENMTKPGAMRAWTKDWRDTERAIREWMELDKPKAQSEAIYRDRMGRAALNRSEADWLDAVNASKPGANLKQTDLDRTFKEFEGDLKIQKMMGGADATEARSLIDLMARTYIWQTMVKGLIGNRAAVSKLIMDSYDMGGLEQVEQDLAELGII